MINFKWSKILWSKKTRKSTGANQFFKCRVRNTVPNLDYNNTILPRSRLVICDWLPTHVTSHTLRALLPQMIIAWSRIRQLKASIACNFVIEIFYKARAIIDVCLKIMFYAATTKFVYVLLQISLLLLLLLKVWCMIEWIWFESHWKS